MKVCYRRYERLATDLEVQLNLPRAVLTGFSWTFVAATTPFIKTQFWTSFRHLELTDEFKIFV